MSEKNSENMSWDYLNRKRNFFSDQYFTSYESNSKAEIVYEQRIIKPIRVSSFVKIMGNMRKNSKHEKHVSIIYIFIIDSIEAFDINVLVNTYTIRLYSVCMLLLATT